MKKIKSLIAALLCVFMMMGYAISASAAEAKLVYSYSGKYATVTDCNTSASGTVTIPKTVKYKSKTYNVKFIGPKAFYSCKKIKKIVIPSGVTASASKRNEYIQWALKGGKIIIEDDFDSEFTLLPKNEDTLFSLESKNSVIYVNTFTKTIAPSMRIGYIVLPENLAERFQDKMGFYSCTVPVFEQYVLAEFINNGDFERHINRVRRKRRREMSL